MTIMGSKRKYAPFIVPILQKCINENNISTFIDCCCGGCNIIKNITCDRRIAIDKNPYLIALYLEMQKPHWIFPPYPLREDWDKCKNGLEEKDWYVGLVQTFTSNFAGGFARGYNKLESVYNGRCNTMKKDLPLIKDIDFICSDFSKILDYENCVIYIDPPYLNTKRYDIDKNFNYEKFWDCVREVSQKNWVFVSEQVAPEDFISVWTLDTERALYSSRTNCTENLFIFKNGLAADFML